MNKQQIDSNLGWLIARVSFTWRKVVDHYMAELGLTQSRWVALFVLKRIGEGCTQRELAAKMGIEQPSLVRTLNQLEEAGLIERRINPNDARSRTLWFTQAGLELNERMEAIAHEGREKMLQGISAEQRQTAYLLLEQILENAQSALGEDEDDR